MAIIGEETTIFGIESTIFYIFIGILILFIVILIFAIRRYRLKRILRLEQKVERLKAEVEKTDSHSEVEPLDKPPP